MNPLNFFAVSSKDIKDNYLAFFFLGCSGQLTDGCLHGQLVPGVWGASKTSIIFLIEIAEGILQVYKDKSLFVVVAQKFIF